LIFDPIFIKEYVDKEINAIESEHNKNIDNDLLILFRSLCLLSNNPETAKFSTGNLDYLKKNDIYDKLKLFYNYYYTCNNIVLFINSYITIEEQYKLLLKYITPLFNTISKQKLYDYKTNKLLIQLKKPSYNIEN
jgi:insulysin